MAESLKREEIVALLSRLGGDDDADVLEAARALHAAVTHGSVGWDKLLTSASAGDPAEAEAASGRPEGDEVPGGADGALALIEKLLARPGLTDDFRHEMEGYKSDIAAGEFADDDHRYLIALDKRLSGKD